MPDDFSANTSTTGRVAVGGSITGDIGAARDQDWFAVELIAGRTYQFDLQGSPNGHGTLSDTYLRAIYDSDGRYQSRTFNDDFAGGRDSRVTFTAGETGTFYVRASGDRRETGTYTLSVTDLSPPETAETEEPVAGGATLVVPIADTATEDLPGGVSTTGVIAVGASVMGTIGTERDRDGYAVELEAGKTYRIDLEGAATGKGTLADPLLGWLRTGPGTGFRGTRDSDGGEGLNARQVFTPTESGTYHIKARAADGGTGTYTLTVTEETAEPLPVVQQAPIFAEQGYAFDLAENADGSTTRVSLGTVAASDPEAGGAELQPGRRQRVGVVRDRRGERRAVLHGCGRGLRVGDDQPCADGAGERRQSHHRHHGHRHRHGCGGRGDCRRAVRRTTAAERAGAGRRGLLRGHVHRRAGGRRRCGHGHHRE